ncbi:MAG TPA: hypothetical protein VN457_08070, partial [Chlamydiales bacterium]|nr:hypothetical protein [Chlamydiales bacterium]
ILYHFCHTVQEALIGKIKPHLRAVKVDVDELKKVFYFWFYYDDEVSSEDRALMESVVQCAHKWPDFSCMKEIEQLPRWQKTPNIGRFLYDRYPDSGFIL